MEPTLDFRKPNEAYKFLFGKDLSERQKEHIAKLCAIYQIKPDNIDILRDIINSGYIEQTENILQHMNTVAKNVAISSMSIETSIKNFENMSTSFLFRLDEKNNGYCHAIDEKNDVFVGKIKTQAVLAAKYFWGAISSNMQDYEKISLNEVNKTLQNSIKTNLDLAFNKMNSSKQSEIKIIIISSGLTILFMAVLWYFFMRP